MTKTYKREMASALMLFYLVILTVGIWLPDARYAEESLRLPVWGTLLGAFGVDAYAKQVKP